MISIISRIFKSYFYYQKFIKNQKKRDKSKFNNKIFIEIKIYN